MSRIGPAAAAKTRKCGGCSKGLNKSAASSIRDRAAMCLWCNRHKPTDDRICPQDGANRLVHITRNDCPLGYFPDAEGVVRWRRIKWIGVPQPVRDHSWKVKGKRTGISRKTWRESFPGCGCIKALKAAWLRLTRMWRKA